MPRRPKHLLTRRVLAGLALAGAGAAVALATGQWELGLATVAAGAVIGTFVRRTQDHDVTSITADPAGTVDRAWERLEIDIELADSDSKARDTVLTRYERDLAAAVKRYPKGHPVRTLRLASTAELMLQQGELQAAALLGCQLVDCLAQAPFELQLKGFALLASIERDGDAPFGSHGIYPWLRDRLVTTSALTQASWAIECAVMEEDRDDLDAAIAHYRDALRILEPSSTTASPYRAGRPARDPAELVAIVDTRTRLASVLVMQGQFDAAYESERELEQHEIDAHQLRWIQRRMAHHAHNIGSYDEARRRLKGLLETAADDDDRARLLDALANIERDLGHVDVAHEYATRAYVLEATDGGAPSSSTLATLARIELELGHGTIAQALLGEAPGIHSDGEIHPRIAEVQALVSCSRGHLDLAFEMAQAALVSAVSTYGSDHLFVTDALHVMGTVLTEAERRDEATSMLGRAIDIVERGTTSHHPQLVKLLEALAHAEHDPGRADHHRARLRRICSAHGLIARSRARA